MEIKPIEEKAYAHMKQRFEMFVQEIKGLCDKPQDKKWLTNKEVCNLLNVKERTLQTYRNYGKIPYSSIGNKCYYKISDVEKLLSNSQAK